MPVSGIRQQREQEEIPVRRDTGLWECHRALPEDVLSVTVQQAGVREEQGGLVEKIEVETREWSC